MDNMVPNRSQTSGTSWTRYRVHFVASGAIIVHRVKIGANVPPHKLNLISKDPPLRPGFEPITHIPDIPPIDPLPPSVSAYVFQRRASNLSIHYCHSANAFHLSQLFANTMPNSCLHTGSSAHPP